MDYDVLILGGGIIGCAVAYELSKYSLNIALIEKDYDVADDISIINSSIVYDGIVSEDSLVTKLQLMGNRMYDELTEKFNVPFKRCGSLFLATTDEEEEKLKESYSSSIKKGIDDIFLLDSNEVYKMEPNLNVSVKKAIYSTNMGVVSPYDLALAYAEVAFDNGVTFKLEEEVINIEKLTRGYRVETNKNKFTCKMVINTIHGNNYNLFNSEREVEEKETTYLKYFLLEKSFKGRFSNIIFSSNKDKDRIYTLQTVQGNTIAAITTKDNVDYNETVKRISSLIGPIKDEDINAFYQTTFDDGDILIDDSSVDKGYIRVLSKHYGEVTMTPYIAKIVCETVVSNINCKLKRNFNDKRREIYRFRDLSNEERQKIIKMDNKYGKIICLCEQITEGEIVDAIRRPLGARTLEGVKRRTGVTLGNCQGSYCMSQIVSILAREMNKNFDDIVKDSKNSKILLNRIKEFDGI